MGSGGYRRWYAASSYGAREYYGEDSSRLFFFLAGCSRFVTVAESGFSKWRDKIRMLDIGKKSKKITLHHKLLSLKLKA